MRFLYYNIAYATGGPNSMPHFWMTMHRYLRRSHRHFESLRRFIHQAEADIVGVVEVDSGSFRTARNCQVKALAEGATRHHSFYSKYHARSMARILPVLRHQGNAILSRQQADEQRSHFFTYGFKRLVMESKIQGVTVYLVHLALSREVRAKQLRDLVRLIGNCHDRPVIVAGDFNTRRGAAELREFIEVTGLVNANRRGLPTFPVWQPRFELDFFLHSPLIKIDRFKVLREVRLSDHLPLLVDFEI